MTQNIQPLPSETEEDFIVRAHGLLITLIPEPAERNAAVWAAWDTAKGNPLEELAQQRFVSDKYTPVPYSPLFMEHQKVNYDSDGNEVITNYDVAELTSIIRENNFRIADTDSFTGLVDKHTVPAGARDPLPPKTLGFVGPYRLGMLGRQHPRWAIFGTEWHRNDRAEVLADRPRRSVEVLQLKANGRRYIDPIAALAEAPRLPLPVHHFSPTDAICERYSALAPSGVGPFGVSEQFEGMAFPGGSNTFVQGFGDKDRNACGPGMSKDKNAGYGDKMLSNNPQPDMIVRMVVDAIMNTPEWQTLQKLTAAETTATQTPPSEPIPGVPAPGETQAVPGMGGESVAVVPSGPGVPAGPDQVLGDTAAPPPDRSAGPAALLPALGKAASVAGSPLGQAAIGAAGQAAGKAKEEGSERLRSVLEGPLQGNRGANTQFSANRDYHRYGGNSQPEGDDMSRTQEPAVDRFQAVVNENEQLRQQYQALSEQHETALSELADVKAHNESILTEQAQHYAAMQSQVLDLVREKANADRRQRLTVLAGRFPSVDVDEECKVCLYSAENEMTDEDFERHLDVIERYAVERIHQSPMIPVGQEPGQRPGSDVQSAQYAAQVADTAIEIVNENLRQGQRIQYNEAVKQAKERLSAS